MHYAARIAKQKEKIYCLQYDEGSREACYFFLKTDPSKEQAFLRTLESGRTDKITYFGKIVASGWGTPSESTKSKMLEKYSIAFAQTQAA